MQLRHIFIAAGHSFFGRHAPPAVDHPAREVAEVECVAGYGLRGDRFFGYRPGYRGQVTFIALEVLAELQRQFQLPALAPSAPRRNLVTAGVDLRELIGRRFTLQGVEFEGMEECRPCPWMNHALAPGAEDWLKLEGRGGLRCRVHRGGWLRSGPNGD